MGKVAQILVAAGKGSRFEGDIPKQYASLGGKTILRQSLDHLKLAYPETALFVIVHAENDSRLSSSLEGFPGKTITTPGGATRSLSVKAGMRILADDPPDFVFIHDAARPYVSQRVMQDMLRSLETHQATAPVLPIVDAVKTIDGGKLGEDVPRSQIRRIQTPQGFRYKDIWPAYKEMSGTENHSDDIAVARTAGLSIGTVYGDEKAFKITYPEDLEKARNMLTSKTYMATGSGYDVHRIEKGNTLWLCGIEIEAGFSLKGHSDADVGLHALTDAIFGALAEGDIGDHFPPDDPQWKGAQSHVFLSHAKDRVKHRNGQIMHVDLTLICEKPKIKPHREQMRNRIADLLEIPIGKVSVKATTTEQLGFTGRGEGIAAQASASVRLPEYDG